MQVKNIKIENYKGIVDAEVAFNDKVNVFVGSNGAGKTSLLKAIDACITQFLSYFGRTKKANGLSANDVNYNKDFVRIKAMIGGNHFNNKPLPVTVSHSNSFSKFSFHDEIEQQDYYLGHLSIALDGILTEHNPFYDIPIYKTYSSKRQILFFSGQKEEKKVDKFISREGKLWNNSNYSRSSFSAFSQWFIAEENNELRQQRDAQDFGLKNPNLEGVRYTINKAFKILSGKDYQIKSAEIDKGISSTSSVEIVLENNLTKQRELLESKSDGEKNIIAFVSDIAYDLTIANTHTKDKYFLNGEGIVLIDEIEAHLHPNWQREIIPLLTKLFPNIQFFITTHSPQIIASVNSENIFTCENFTYEKIDIKTKGTDTNTLLQYVFNASERPRAYIERIKRFGEMIDAEKPSEEIEGIIKEVRALEAEDNGTDVSQLSSELELRLEAYKFDMEHEVD